MASVEATAVGSMCIPEVSVGQHNLLVILGNFKKAGSEAECQHMWQRYDVQMNYESGTVDKIAGR